MTSEDIARVKRGPADLEERIEQLMKQKEILKAACKKAGARIGELEGEISIIKGIGMNSPEMRALKKQKEFLQEKCRQAGAEINELKRDNKQLAQEVGDYIDRITRGIHA